MSKRTPDGNSMAESNAEPKPDPELLARIMAHPLGKPTEEASFVLRLARENGWARNRAFRVIVEYRRFAYLACISQEELTPSDAVDQVWHLHLADTHGYWDLFCAEVLRRRLHHVPSAGGEATSKRFEANYVRTLLLYRHIFGEMPPSDIWPPVAERFQFTGQYTRVNRGLFEIKPRSGRFPSLIELLVVKTLVLAVSYGFALGGIVLILKFVTNNPQSYSIFLPISGAIAIFAGGALIAILIQRNKSTIVPELPHKQPPCADPPGGSQDDELLARIRAYELDRPGARQSFFQRLARENGWPINFTLNVIEEYQRFVYLACISEEELIPSDQVDQVWRLHLSDTREYWEVFCKEVLKRPLHRRSPEGVGTRKDRNKAAYLRTLALYKAAFKMEPPVNIWPPAEIRFRFTGQFERVNRALFTVMPQDELLRSEEFNPIAKLIGLLLLLLPVFLVWPFREEEPSAHGAEILGSFVAIMALLYFLFDVLPKLSRLPRPSWPSIWESPRSLEVPEIMIYQPQHGYEVSYCLVTEESENMEVGPAASKVEISISGDCSSELGGWDNGGGGDSSCGSGY